MTRPTGSTDPVSAEDYRMEYAALMTAYTSVSNMYWTGYTAFFAVNTLLATGIALSLSTEETLSAANLLQLAHIGLPLIGMSMSIIALYAAFEIRRHQAAIAKRGREIDTYLSTNSFTSLPSGREGFPIATAIGSALFFLVWAGVLLASL